MKFIKFFILFLFFILSLCPSFSAEEDSLFIVKNIPQENLNNLLINYLSHNRYNFIKKSDFYIVKNNSNDIFFEILLEPIDKDCYLYYYSSKNSLELLTPIMNEFRKAHLKIKKISLPEQNNYFKQKAISIEQEQKKSAQIAKNYSFDDNAQKIFNETNQISYSNNEKLASNPHIVLNNQPSEPLVKSQKASILKTAKIEYINTTPKQKPNRYTDSSNINNNKTLKGSVIIIPQGSVINAVLQSSISSASLAQSDRITAILEEDFKINNSIILPVGTILYGSALNASAASFGYGNGSLDLTFNQALLPSGNKVNLSVDKISYVKKSSRAINISRDVVVGAGIGALTGILSAVYTGNYAQAALIGASVGAAGGGIHSASQRGEDIEITEGTKLILRVNQPINISP